MARKILYLFILLAFTTFIAAEEIDFMRMMRSDLNRQYHKSANRTRYKAMWNGNGAVISAQSLWQDEGFRQELAFTDEQNTELDFMYSKNGSMGHWYQAKAKTNPELAKYLEEGNKYQQTRRSDPYGEKMSDADKNAWLDHLTQGTEMYFAETQKDVENCLTPEQMQKVRESELAMMSEIPILNPSMFNALDLTDEQKAQMEAIKKELEPEFDKIVEELVTVEDELQEIKWDFFVKNGITFNENGELELNGAKIDRSNPDALKKMEDLGTRLEKDERVQKMSKRINERASNFMKGFKFRMFDVLTDAQLTRMQKIIENPSKYVKKILDRGQKVREEQEKAAGGYRPGPDSWRPGKPLPEWYLKQREEEKKHQKPRKPFPRSESVTE